MEQTQMIRELAQGILPKWPQMLVTGRPVTVEQAKEIIFLTDAFLTDASEYSGGNCHEFNQFYRKLAGLDQLQVERKYPEGLAYRDADWDRMHKLRSSLGFVNTNYVHNDWASCSFIGGPHGWCHPDGTISFSDNVGKWPSIDEILHDWSVVACAFPFLDLNVTLMSGESCEDDSEPVINIRVLNGEARPETPDISVHQWLKAPSTQDTIAAFIAQMNAGTSREIGLPHHWYELFGERVRKAIARL